MNALDSTGLKALEELNGKIRESGRTLLLCGARRQPMELMERSGFRLRIGEDNVLPNVRAAIDRALILLQEAVSVDG